MLMWRDSAADWDEDWGVTLVRWEGGGTDLSSPPSFQHQPPPPLSLADTDHPPWLLVFSAEEHNDKINTGLSGENCLGKKSFWNRAEYLIGKLQCNRVASIWYSWRHPLIHELNLDFPVDFLKSFSLDFPKFLSWKFITKDLSRSNLSSKVNSPQERFLQCHHSRVENIKYKVGTRIVTRNRIITFHHDH